LDVGVCVCVRACARARVFVFGGWGHISKQITFKGVTYIVEVIF